MQVVFDLLFWLFLFLSSCFGFLFLDGGLPLRRKGDESGGRGQNQERSGGQAGYQRKCDEHTGGDHDRTRFRRQLTAEVGSEVVLRGRPGNDDTGRNRCDQRRNLRDQTVTDRQDRVGLGGVGREHLELENADGQTTQDVDEGDQDTGDGVAPDELAGTVHCAVEIRFPRDVLPACARFLFRDEPGVQVGVDAHLLTGHRVQREPCRDFGNTPGALRDHHKLDDHDDQEDDHTQDVVAFDHELPEGVDHLTGVSLAQNQPRGRDVQGQAK